MWRSRLAAYGASLVVLLDGCGSLSGQDTYINKQYESVPKAAKKLAIVPLTRLGDSLDPSGKSPLLTKVTDEYFEKSFADSPGRVSLTPMAKARSFFQTNPDLLDKLLDATYSKQQLKNSPGLKNILDSAEVSRLRQGLDGADLILVPAKLDLVPQWRGIFGYSEFRLYDLDSTSMIYSVTHKMNLNRIDEPGRGLMALALIGQASKDFKTLYLRHGMHAPGREILL